MAVTLKPAPLTRDAFAPYGDVIQSDGAARFAINNGSTTRFHDLARVDVSAGDGHALINIFRAEPLVLPLAITMVEQHPLGSQAFVPLGGEPFLIVVAAAGETVAPADLRAFVTDGRQGINYARGTWHHPVIAMDRRTDFLVIDRGGDGENLVEEFFGAGEDQAVLVRPA